MLALVALFSAALLPATRHVPARAACRARVSGCAPAPETSTSTDASASADASTDAADDFFLLGSSSYLLGLQREQRAVARKMERAASAEDYAAAATLKGELSALQQQDPVFQLRSALREAVRNEDFSAAAKAHAALSRLRARRPTLLWRDQLLVLHQGGRSLGLYPGSAASVDGAGAQAEGRTIYTAPQGSTLQQPTWSPDGESIAVSEVGEASSRVLVLSCEGDELASAPTPACFYLQFSPDGSALTFLHAEPNLVPGGPTLVLGALELRGARRGAARYVRPGGPLFYAIGAAESRPLLTHNGFLGELAISDELGEGDRTVLATFDGPPDFRAPLLSPDGTHALYVRAGEVVSQRVDGGDAEVLVSLGADVDHVSLHLSPDGRALAVLSSRPVGEGGGELRFEHELRLLRAPTAEAMLSGTGERDAKQLPSTVALCCWWSPDSKSLLCLEGALGGGAAPRRLRAAWCVWTLSERDDDGGGKPPVRRSFDPFTPSDRFVRTVLPFADQYAQAVTPWSPDSSAFVYVAASGDVRVQRLDEPLAAGPLGLLVAPDAETVDGVEGGGEAAFWSPC